MRALRVIALVLVACVVLGLARANAQPPERPGAAPSTSGAAASAPGSAQKPRASSSAQATENPAQGRSAAAGEAGPTETARSGKATDGKAAGAGDLRASEPKRADAKPGEKRPSEAKAGAAPSGPPAAAPPPGATAARPSGGGDEVLDGSTYIVRMRDLAQRVDELKEQIRRSHTRLSLLSDTILSGGGGGARAEIRFGNELSSAFRLTRLLVVLDGAVQYNRQDDTGALAKQREIPIFSGSIPPGDHTLQVLVKLQGYGYGVFSYLRGYHFEYKSSTSFTVTAGKTIELRAIAMEKGSVTTPLEERPSMRFVQNIRETGSGDAAPGVDAPGVAPGANKR